MILRVIHPSSGKSKDKGSLAQVAGEYRKRIERRYRTDVTFVRPARLAPRPDAGQVERALALEGERMLARVGPRDRLIALSIDARPWSSEQLAERLERWLQASHSAIAFAVGSAHGMSPEVLRRAHERWSFGPLTLPHELALVVLWEQLYRATAILHGEPYHK